MTQITVGKSPSDLLQEAHIPTQITLVLYSMSSSIDETTAWIKF